MATRQKTGLSRRQFLGTTGKAMIAIAACKWMRREACAATHPDICVDAICGIYCGACSMQMESVASENKCFGCRSTSKAPAYALQCEVKKCAEAQQLQSCGLCKTYPCEKIQAFFKNQPIYGLREKNLNTIRDKGRQAWLNEQKARWTCQKCKTPFCYDTKVCKKCGEKVYSAEEEFEDFKKAKAAKAKS